MRINKGVAVQGQSILLVPYEACHVETYHGWMQDEELQELTASEPLSIDEEYAMQKRWRDDNDKLTFIICQGLADVDDTAPRGPGKHERMVGDINLFLLEDDDDDADAAKRQVIGEIELMIAKTTERGKGSGKRALQAFLQYITTHLEDILAEHAGNEHETLKYLRVKISQSNSRSIALFEHNGFKSTSSGPNYFGEIELRLYDLQSHVKSFAQDNYGEISYADEHT